jgi:HSP20 family protein
MSLSTTPVSRRPALAVVRRWDPFREMEDVYDRMGQLVADLVSQPARQQPGEPPSMVAPADIEETDDSYVIDVDLPGVRLGDVDLELRDNELRITGEIKDRQRTGVLRRKERPAGVFEYVIMLPGDVDPDRVEAHLNDGVLNVRLPKATASKARHIAVIG